MPYAHRNSKGEIVTLTRWPNGSIEQLDANAPEVVAFTNPTPPPDPDVEWHTAIMAATTLDELKDALVGQPGSRGVAGKPI